jgi:hypothetical protein
MGENPGHFAPGFIRLNAGFSNIGAMIALRDCATTLKA